MIKFESAIKMENAEFEAFSKIVSEQSGIVISKDKRALLESRLSKRLRILKLKDFGTYFQFVQDNIDRELIELLDVITTNVTSFFREDDHFTILGDFFLKNKLLEVKKSQSKKVISIWCAGCSTGEEPLSMIISLLENLGANPIKIKILATDLSLTCLKKAKNSLYEKSSLKKLSPAIIQKYFSDEGEYYRAREILSSKITWRQFNLKNNFQFDNKFDAIFCRNVMIYFDQYFRNKLVENFRRSLKSDGMFFIGLSESITSHNSKFKYYSPSVYINKGGV
ncbi:methyltransferase domain-containing protein [bacterium]|nr:methyltransferase domain-containing protein [bacterium]